MGDWYSFKDSFDEHDFCLSLGRSICGVLSPQL